MLETRPELQVIGRVSDGLEAVQKAEKLQPDLILLDIGLPTLSGIEAARRIRKLSPESKIIFLTQESSADLVREALSLGAKGYVVKAKAGSELLIAIEAVQKAEKLQPDLILLDIGLPTLSGIEAARRIRKLSPESKIIFLTQESSADLVREALSLGAKGYVVKAKAGSELLIAMEAVR